jgi:hypothetical protein
MCDPEAALVRKADDGSRFPGESGAHRVKRVNPTRRSEIGDDLRAVWQMHERATSAGLLEITIAELDESWILFFALPTSLFKAPEDSVGRRRIAIVRREEERRARNANSVQLAQRRATVLASRNLHHPIEHEKRPRKSSGELRAESRELGDVGVKEHNRLCAAFSGKAAGLIDQLFSEIERSEIPVTERPETQRYAAGAAASLEERGGAVNEVALDQETLGSPEAQLVRGARVVQDREEVVKIVADGFAGDLFHSKGG